MSVELRSRIEAALRACAVGGLAEGARGLLDALGYRSDRAVDLASSDAAGFAELLRDMGREAAFNAARARGQDWQSVDLLFQLSDAELQDGAQLGLGLEGWDAGLYKSFLFIAIDLAADGYTRTDLAEITRAVNRPFAMPVPILFRHHDRLTLAVILRRPSKVDAARDVLEKVTLVKDIALAQPHAGHVRILEDLALETLAGRFSVANFDGLLAAWSKTLDTAELNKTFYRELANWYAWAQTQVTFPPGGGEDAQQRNATGLIRLVTRLIFVWFLKEKGLAPETLFHRGRLADILTELADDSSSYYRAILQNLFFATLNTEMADPKAPRRFRGKNEAGRDGHRLVHTVYRYADLFRDPDAALRLFADIPFLNGGLFECLDRGLDAGELERDPALRVRATLEGKTSWALRVDGFSERPENPLSVPNRLFFCDECQVDLNEWYHTQGRRYRVRGLIELFGRYKFTVEENTPVEEEVALDPELLGKVFENLLAEYNPETGVTARKQTGSFYTPREIVDYMVDESLVAYLAKDLHAEDLRGLRDLEGLEGPDLETRLRDLLAYTVSPPAFSPPETERLVAAIDGLKVLDPACGSGAFPMGVLHKLVTLLRKLDPDNTHWRELQRRKAVAETDAAYRIGERGERQARLLDIEEAFERNSSDYGRKLYLIENCIYGVDIQPIAVQIAKLRCFIALVVEQTLDNARPNRGIRPLPNLETKFVAANTLIGVARPQPQAPAETAPPAEVRRLYDELLDTFRQYLKVMQPANKEKWLAQGRELCAELNRRLAGRPDFQPLEADWLFPTLGSVEALRDKLPGAERADQAATLALRSPEVEAKEGALAEVRRRHFAARTPATKEKCRADDRRLREALADLLRRDGWGSDTAAQLAAWDPYDHNAHAPFFDPEWMFGVREGFDIVIGNPPYVRQEQISDLKPALKGQYDCYSGTADLYVYFYERSLRTLREGGILTFISSNKYFRSGYGEKLRRFLGERSTILHLIDFGDAPVFTAIAYPSIIIARKAPPGDHQTRALTWSPNAALDEFPAVFQASSFLIAQKRLTSNGWQLELPAVLRLLEKLRGAGQPLGDYVNGRFYRGILTGLNEAWVVDRATRDRLIAGHPSSADLLKPFLRGRDVKRWRVEFADQYLIKIESSENKRHPWSGKPDAEAEAIFAQTYPAIHAHFQGYREELMRREDQGKYFWELRSCSYWEEFGQSKIVIPTITQHVQYAPDWEGCLSNDKTTICVTEAVNYLLGLLNSSSLWWFIQKTAATKQGGFYEFKPMYISQIPIRVGVDHRPIEGLVDRILTAKRADPAADVSALEREIDQLVYRLYGLTAEEIAIVEERSA